MVFSSPSTAVLHSAGNGDVVPFRTAGRCTGAMVLMSVMSSLGFGFVRHCFLIADDRSLAAKVRRVSRGRKSGLNDRPEA